MWAYDLVVSLWVYYTTFLVKTKAVFEEGGLVREAVGVVVEVYDEPLFVGVESEVHYPCLSSNIMRSNSA